MTDDWLENEKEELRNFGVSAPISRRIREQLKIEEESRKFQKKLRDSTMPLKIKAQYDCPVCNEPMEKNLSLTTGYTYWFCKCFGRSLDTLELIHVIHRRKNLPI